MIVYFIAMLSILWLFGVFFGHLVYVSYGYLVYFPHFGKLYQEKSGNPDWLSFRPLKFAHSVVVYFGQFF
jgi:hypothetical protein